MWIDKSRGVGCRSRMKGRRLLCLTGNLNDMTDHAWVTVPCSFHILFDYFRNVSRDWKLIGRVTILRLPFRALIWCRAKYVPRSQRVLLDELPPLLKWPSRNGECKPEHRETNNTSRKFMSRKPWLHLSLQNRKKQQHMAVKRTMCFNIYCKKNQQMFASIPKATLGVSQLSLCQLNTTAVLFFALNEVSQQNCIIYKWKENRSTVTAGWLFAELFLFSLLHSVLVARYCEVKFSECLSLLWFLNLGNFHPDRSEASPAAV